MSDDEIRSYFKHITVMTRHIIYLFIVYIYCRLHFQIVYYVEIVGYSLYYLQIR